MPSGRLVYAKVALIVEEDHGRTKLFELEVPTHERVVVVGDELVLTVRVQVTESGFTDNVEALPLRNFAERVLRESPPVPVPSRRRRRIRVEDES